MSRRIVSSSPARAWTISEFERRSGDDQRRPLRPSAGVGRAGAGGRPRRRRGRRAPGPARRRGAGARARRRPAGKSWVRMVASSAASACWMRDDLQLVERHLDVDEPDDVEQPAHVGRGVGDDQDARLAVAISVPRLEIERAQQRAQIVHGAIPDGHDLRDDLVARAAWDRRSPPTIVGTARSRAPSIRTIL